MENEFLFLGTGGSEGIPSIGCQCPVCTSSDSHNKRLRPSGVVTIGSKRFLIDTGPDFRAQALLYQLNHLDGVLITHTHFDHVAGLDELRVYYLLHRTTLPVLVSETSFKDLKRRYDYFFRKKSWGMSLSAQLDFQVFKEDHGEIEFQEVPIRYVTYEQGGMPVNGFCFNNFAYVSDIKDYPETIFEQLHGTEILVISALRKSASMMHLSLEEAIAFSKAVGAKKTYFTHIGHELEHEQTNASLPEGFALAYDGLTLNF
ncbi:MAG: MBL fold metallo-hydrolase [Chlamydiales bacterium]